jgi:hypothetical protein
MRPTFGAATNLHAPALPASKESFRSIWNETVRAPVAGGTHRCGLPLGSNLGRQIPRDFETGSDLAHGRLLPAFLHFSSPLLPPLEGVDSVSVRHRMAPLRDDWSITQNGQTKH